MPSMLALADKVIGNTTIAYFAAFGSFAMLLLVDFGGTILDRIRAQALLGVTCAALVCLATLASQSTAVATIAMFLVGFLIIFSGVVSSVLAGATTALLLSFIVPLTTPAPASAIADRVAGWGLAAAVSVIAITVLWPAPAVNPVRVRAGAACRALAARLRADIAWVHSDGGDDARAAHAAAVEQAAAASTALQTQFFATPYRQTGLATDARAVIRLVDELRWLAEVILLATPRPRGNGHGEAVCAVKRAAASGLEEAATLLDDPGGSTAGLARARTSLREALTALEGEATRRPLLDPPGPDTGTGTDGAIAERVLSSLDPSFRAQELSFVVDQIAANVELAAAAARRPWLHRLIGRQPAGLGSSLMSFRERALAHVRPDSSWLHNSLRGATGLALALLIADLTSIQHGFWVVFGTLAVLRSNALSTGQTVVRALAGTTTGFIVGGALVALIGTNATVLWLLLPVVVLCAGLAPAAVSFLWGQAAFTVTLLVLFNLLVPIGWRIGIVRIEDVAIGGAVSLAVGLLFWPRGAGADLGRSLSGAYRDASAYLAGAVAYGVGRCDAQATPVPVPREQAQRAAAAARRLDDTFRGYLVERGAKAASLADVSSLVSGVAGVRLAADAVLDLWDGDAAHGGEREAARRELLGAAQQMITWYEAFAAGLTGTAEVPEPADADASADGRLIEAVAHDLRDADGRATATGVRVIWTGDHLDAIRRLERRLVGPARAAVRRQSALAGSEAGRRG
jgi:uncharacterized membrane protein YccC